MLSIDKKLAEILTIRVFNPMVRARQHKNRRKKKYRQEQKILYSEAIDFLLEKSLEFRSTNPELSKDYLLSAQKMGMRGRHHLPKPYRLFFCRSCNSPVHTSTMQIRLNSTKKQISYNCLNCGNINRFGYIKEYKRDLV